MPTLKDYRKISEPIEKFNSAQIIPNKSALPSPVNPYTTHANIFTYGHNPITNPMPFNIQVTKNNKKENEHGKKKKQKYFLL